MPRPALLGQAGLPYAGWVGSCVVFRPGWAGTAFPGRIIYLLADLAPPGPGFTSSGTYSSSGIDSSILCQSWDALWLRLAHTPSLCWSWDAPWLTPACSSSTVVSLILRRRIRLMTSRSRRHTLEDEDQVLQGQTSMGQAHDHDAVHSTEDGTMLMQATV
jgi:hypothetical protein